MRRGTKKLHENQRLGRSTAQNAPRSRGSSAPVTQSAEAAGVADAAQLPRLSSARANNSASFGSFPDVSSISRLRMQPTAARRAGHASPWHDQPPRDWHWQAWAGILD
jgi:hypothetical protein